MRWNFIEFKVKFGKQQNSRNLRIFVERAVRGGVNGRKTRVKVERWLLRRWQNACGILTSTSASHRDDRTGCRRPRGRRKRKKKERTFFFSSGAVASHASMITHILPSISSFYSCRFNHVDLKFSWNFTNFFPFKWLPIWTFWNVFVRTLRRST